MNLIEYIEAKKEMQEILFQYLDNEDNINANYQLLIDIIKKQNFEDDKHEFKLFLYLLSKILKNHHREPQFFNKIEQIILNFKQEIIKNFTNYDIFNLFKKNKRILLFLLNEKIIQIDNSIISKMKLMGYFKFFSIEIKKFVNELIRQEKNLKTVSQLNSFINNNEELCQKIPEDFEYKRICAENDSYICELIRKDLIQDFIIYVNKNNLSLHSNIETSIYETNSFLISKKVSLIEYAAFFGSNQIFKYLFKNDVDLTSSLWLYSIHGRNPEIIHILEDMNVKPDDESYEECLKESIKCHHNEIANYIINNYVNNDNKEKFNNFYKNINFYGYNYYNFSFIPNDFDEKFIIYYSCLCDYFKIVDFLLKNRNFDVNEKINIGNKEVL